VATRGARFGDSLCGQFTGFLSLRREWATGLWGRPELPLAPAEIHPKGIIVFTSDGRFIYLYSRGDLPKFASNNRATGTADENKAVVQGSIATFGTYSVAGKELSLKIEHSGSGRSKECAEAQITPLIAAGIRIFSLAPQSSNQFASRRRTAFGRPAACRNVTVLASKFPALGPMPHCKKSQLAGR